MHEKGDRFIWDFQKQKTGVPHAEDYDRDICLVFKLPRPPDSYSPLQYSITSSLKMTRFLSAIILGALPLLASAQQAAYGQCGGTGCKLYINYIYSSHIFGVEFN